MNSNYSNSFNNSMTGSDGGVKVLRLPAGHVRSQHLLDRQYSQRLSSSCNYSRHANAAAAANTSLRGSDLSAINDSSCGARKYGRDNNTLSYDDVNFRDAKLMTLEEIQEERRNYGLCLTCDEDPTHCHRRRSKRGLLSKSWTPLTEPGVVYQGICLRCHPERDPDAYNPSSSFEGDVRDDSTDRTKSSGVRSNSRHRSLDGDTRSAYSGSTKFKFKKEHKLPEDKRPPGLVSSKSLGAARLASVGIGISARKLPRTMTHRSIFGSARWSRRGSSAYQELETGSTTSSDSSVLASSIEGGAAGSAPTTATTTTTSMVGANIGGIPMASPGPVAAVLTPQQALAWTDSKAGGKTTPARNLPSRPLSSRAPPQHQHSNNDVESRRSLRSQPFAAEYEASAAIAASLAEKAVETLAPSPLCSPRGTARVVSPAAPRVGGMRTAQPIPSESSHASSYCPTTPMSVTSTLPSIATPSSRPSAPFDWSAADGPDLRHAQDYERTNFVSPQMSTEPRSVSFRIKPTTPPPQPLSELSRRQTVANDTPRQPPQHQQQQRRSINPHITIEKSADDEKERKARAKAFQAEQDRLDAIEDSANVHVLKGLVQDMMRNPQTKDEAVIAIVADYMVDDPNCQLVLQTYGICTLLSLCCFADTETSQQDSATMRHDLWRVIFSSPIVDAVVKAIATAAASSSSASASASTRQLVHLHLQDEHSNGASRERRSLCLRSGCELLRALAVGYDSDFASSSHYRASLAQAGALRAVVAALSQCGEEEVSEETAQVAMSALAAFRALAPAENSMRKKENNNDNDSVSIRSQRSTSTSSHVLRRSSLRRKQSLEDYHHVWGRELGLAWSGLVATLKLMDEYYDSSAMQHEGCRTLSVLSAALAHWSTQRKDDFHNGRPVVEALLGALSFYPDHGDVQEAACEALQACFLAMPWRVVEAAMGRRRKSQPLKRLGSTKQFASLHNVYNDEENASEALVEDDEMENNGEDDEDETDLIDPLCYYLLSAAVDFPKECGCIAQNLIDRLLYVGGKTGDDDSDEDDNKADDERNIEEQETDNDEDSEWEKASEDQVYESLVRTVLKMAGKDRAYCPSTFKRKRRRRHHRLRSGKGGNENGSGSGSGSSGCRRRNPLQYLHYFVRNVVQHMEKMPESTRIQSVGVLGLSFALMMKTGTQQTTLSSSSLSSLCSTNTPPRVLSYTDVDVLGLALEQVLGALQRHGTHRSSSIPSRAAALLLSACQHPCAAGAPLMVLKKTQSRRKQLRKLGAVDVILHVMTQDEQAGGEDVQAAFLQILAFMLMDDGAFSALGKDEVDRIEKTVLVIMAASDDSESIQSAAQEVLNCFNTEEEEDKHEHE